MVTGLGWHTYPLWVVRRCDTRYCCDHDECCDQGTLYDTSIQSCVAGPPTSSPAPTNSPAPSPYPTSTETPTSTLVPTTKQEYETLCPNKKLKAVQFGNINNGVTVTGRVKVEHLDWYPEKNQLFVLNNDLEPLKAKERDYSKKGFTISFDTDYEYIRSKVSLRAAVTVGK